MIFHVKDNCWELYMPVINFCTGGEKVRKFERNFRSWAIWKALQFLSYLVAYENATRQQ
ncbi:hypothetical protein D3C79_1059900 [compost metagenome]